MTNNYEIRGNIAVIFLKKKDGTEYETIIDVSDLEKANSLVGTWYPSFHRNTHYVIGPITKTDKKNRIYKVTTIGLHRFLHDNIPTDMVVDHINHDTLDNRRSINLRVVTQKENMNNTKKSYLASKKNIFGG